MVVGGRKIKIKRKEKEGGGGGRETGAGVRCEYPFGEGEMS
jgi:hypothetical protein